MGTVGDNETSSIRCTCPREFDYVEYDIPTQDWKDMLTGDTGLQIDQITVRNLCNPAVEGLGKCADQSSQSTRVRFKFN